jgi:2,5-diketo-D-gluconate reductase A
MTINVRALPLADGTSIPQLGLGVWQMSNEEADAAVRAAAAAGYTLIDTAAGYENEGAVGKALADLGPDRFYVTTKLRNADQGYDEALRAFDRSMAELGTDVLDLYLIHWPSPAREKYVDSWRALTRLKEEGRVRSIGVSNFQKAHLERIVAETGTAPVVNQIELHPLLQQRALREYHAAHNIATEAWSPLGSGAAGVLQNPALEELATRKGCTVAQAVLAWHLAIGNIVIPKSVTPSRIAENIGATGVTLDESDLGVIEALDDGTRFGPHPDDLN